MELGKSEAKKYIPGLGKQVFIAEDELSPELQQKIQDLIDKVEALENT